MSRASRPPLLPWSKSTWERWASMPRMSAGVIPRTKFLLLKAPASTLYEERFGGDRNMFTIAMYGGRMMAKGVQVGCVIDCTALDLPAFEVPPDGKPVRYFHDTNEWDDFDMMYHALDPVVDAEGKSPPGASANTVPPPEAVQKFLSVCASHWKSRPNECVALFDSRGGIGVASYLAALYMCEKMRAPVHVALASVRQAMQPCGLADADLARELQRKYRGRREIKIENIPKWWFAVDDDEDDDDEDDEKDGGEAKKKREREDMAIVIPPFDQMGGNGAKDDDASGSGLARKRPRPGEGGGADAPAKEYPPVPGLQPQPPGSQRYERAVTVLKQLTGRPCDSGIPTGSEVALSSAEALISNLTHGRYKATWSSRGRRGLLLVLTEGAYFVENAPGGSTLAVSTVKMRFPHPTEPGRTQHRTLLDGVLVTDREGPASVPRYYATDILCHMGGTLTSRPFGQRIKYLVDGVIMARKRDAATGAGGHDYGREPVKIRANEYFELGKLGFVLKDVTRGVAHETSGVTLAPKDGKYYGTAGGAPGGDVLLVWENGGEVSEDALLKHAGGL